MITVGKRKFVIQRKKESQNGYRKIGENEGGREIESACKKERNKELKEKKTESICEGERRKTFKFRCSFGVR